MNIDNNKSMNPKSKLLENSDSKKLDQSNLNKKEASNNKILLFFSPNQNDLKIIKQKSHFGDNTITTTKYNIITWLPKSLLSQFTRVANIYFLIITILTCLSFSPKNPYTQIMTFTIVLLFTMFKEGYEDYKRYLQDREINKKKCEVYDYKMHKFILKEWGDINVGEILKINKDEQIPCDILFLISSMTSGLCFVDTMNLDGETNLKEKLIHPLFKSITIDNIPIIEGSVNCDPPNELLEFWECNLKIDCLEMEVSCGIKQLILKGCILKNTEYIIGVAVYTGHNSKIMKNAKKSPIKTSNVMKLMNILLISVFIFQVSLCILFSGLNMAFRNTNGSELEVYIKLDQSTVDVYQWFIKLLTFEVAYSHLIPISLYVAMEIVKLIQSLLIFYDDNIYDEKIDRPSIAKTSDLIEELGQVDFIFSDKTGTLTQNVMEFMKCSINGVIYGNTNISAMNTSFAINGDDSAYKNLISSDPSKKSDSKAIKNFFTLISVCHSACSERTKDGLLKYSSSSPDEIALIQGASKFGWVFTNKTSSTIEVENMHTKELEIYELLVEIPFDSTRKRMSVIVKKQGEEDVICMTKGSDNMIMERCIFPDIKKKNELQDHLNNFACEGLRTLAMGQRLLDLNFFNEWYKNYQKCLLILDTNEKENLLNNLYDEIEGILEPVGCSAIEDKLQIDVPDTIDFIIKSDIKFWVLTGDKKETALNIGKTCKVIEEIGINEIDMTYTEEVDNEDNSDLFERLDLVENSFNIKFKTLHEVKNITLKENLYMIIDGRNLITILKDEALSSKFFKVGLLCNSVICCRVSPKQKSEVVSLVKTYSEWIALSIGDGANDVPMILEANIGVGIQGKEGTQAVRSADYSISQFKYLKRLLFVHGRYGYRRISLFICYYFYKNIICVFSEMYFAFYNGFSGQIFFADFLPMMYNAFWTSWPCIFAFSFEKDVDENKFFSFSKLYKAGHSRYYFNMKVFWLWLFFALAHGTFIHFITILSIKFDSQSEGNIVDHWNYTTLAFCLIIHVVTYKIFIEMSFWNNIIIFFSILSVLFYYATIIVLNIPGISKTLQNELCWKVFYLFSKPYFWIVIIILPLLIILPDISYKYIQNFGFPCPADKVISQDEQEHESLKGKGEVLNNNKI